MRLSLHHRQLRQRPSTALERRSIHVLKGPE
jgi:hypothetical protein